jgi:hypothetical protein
MQDWQRPTIGLKLINSEGATDGWSYSCTTQNCVGIHVSPGSPTCCFGTKGCISLHLRNVVRGFMSPLLFSGVSANATLHFHASALCDLNTALAWLGPRCNPDIGRVVTINRRPNPVC